MNQKTLDQTENNSRVLQKGGEGGNGHKNCSKNWDIDTKINPASLVIISPLDGGTFTSAQGKVSS